jgi:hypothetical protein
MKLRASMLVVVLFAVGLPACNGCNRNPGTEDNDAGATVGPTDAGGVVPDSGSAADAATTDAATTTDAAGSDAAGTDSGTVVTTDAGGDAGPLPDAASTPDAAPPACVQVPVMDGLTLHVDPLAGNDSMGTGSADCPYASVARAVSTAMAASRLNMTITVDVTATLNAASGEAFPIVLPATTTLTAASGVVATFSVTTGNAFELSAAGNTLRSLVVDGLGTATSGIVASAADTLLSGVEVKGFTNAGLHAMDGAVVHVTAGTQLHHNGVPNPPSGNVGPAGLLAVGTALVNIDGTGATDQAPTRISENLGRGVEARGQARVNITGTLTTLNPSLGTVVVAGNTLDGVFVQQLLVSDTGTPPTGMSISGLVSKLNGLSGLHAYGGSGVAVRGSFLSGNTFHGVHVETNPAFVNGGSGANTGNDLLRLDLGNTATRGHSILQDVTTPNTKKGVCVQLQTGNGTGGPLMAQGNKFASGGSNVDCSTVAASLPATSDCDAQGPLASVGRNPRNDLDVSDCVIP